MSPHHCAHRALSLSPRVLSYLRQDLSPQSYAYDRDYFARSGQLYMIIIGQIEDKEDWELYDHFLDSFQVE